MMPWTSFVRPYRPSTMLTPIMRNESCPETITMDNRSHPNNERIPRRALVFVINA